jgi:hypothetical protein
MSLAIKLLRGSVAVITAPADHHCQHQQQQQQQEEQGEGQQEQGQLEQQQTQEQQEAANQQLNGSSSTQHIQAATAELARLAYCSLTASVMQVLVQQQQQQLGEGCVGELLALAGELVQVAQMQDSNSSSGCGAAQEESSASSISSSGYGHSMQAGAGAASTEHGAAGSSHSSGLNSSSDDGGGSTPAVWGVAASLAAAVAAGAYAAHHPDVQAAAAAWQAEGRASGGEQQAARESCREAAAAAGSSCTTATSTSSSSSTAGATGCGEPSYNPTGISTCPDRCPICRVAARVFVSLRLLEGDTAPATSQDSAASQGASLIRVAKQHGATLQHLLCTQLVALAWRHPVPGVCGNVLCGRHNGPAAAGAVWGCVGTRCGGCRAAWYCTESCRGAAWPPHRVVCRAASHSM